MKIELYLEALLYRYQCVTVPGFGAFLTEIQSAQWNQSSNAFFPPKKLVSFNAQLKNNDGLLANHIAKIENIAYDKAIVVIENEVSYLSETLLTNGKITLKNIGQLSLNTEKNIVFVPFDQPNYLMESFGLSSFIAPSIKREIEFVREENVTIPLVPSLPEVIKIEERYSNPYLKYAAVVAITLSVMGSIGFKIQQDRVDASTLMVQTEVQKEVHNKIQEATFFIDAPLPSVTLALKNEKMPYHIVAGAFRLAENAEKVAADLKSKGFNAKKIRTNNHGLFPVIYGSYASYSEAQKAMSTIKESENPEAWLLIEEL
ncbi:MAG: SPOR domain-containing protein [Bacteroidota bacterium]